MQIVRSFDMRNLQSQFGNIVEKKTKVGLDQLFEIFFIFVIFWIDKQKRFSSQRTLTLYHCRRDKEFFIVNNCVFDCIAVGDEILLSMEYPTKEQENYCTKSSYDSLISISTSHKPSLKVVSTTFAFFTSA